MSQSNIRIKANSLCDMAQFNEQSCRAFHLERERISCDMSQSKSSCGQTNVCLLSRDSKKKREAAERAAERESALAREAAERGITLARMAHKLEMARLEAAHERPQEQDRVAQAPEDIVRRHATI